MSKKRTLKERAQSLKRKFRVRWRLCRRGFWESLPIILLTLVMVCIYSKTNKISEYDLELEKFKQTSALCSDFNDWFWMYSYDHRDKHSDDLVYLHEWSRPDWAWDNEENRKIRRAYEIWEQSDETAKLNLLYNSSEVNRLFNYFENAKMLNKKELLDDEYLYNFFITTVYGLVKATGPTLEDYMKKLRGVKPNGDSEFYNDYNPATWDGFEYCLENIFIPQLYKNINEKENQGSEKKMFQDLKACYNKLVEMYGNGKLIEYSY